MSKHGRCLFHKESACGGSNYELETDTRDDDAGYTGSYIPFCSNHRKNAYQYAEVHNERITREFLQYIEDY